MVTLRVKAYKIYEVIKGKFIIVSLIKSILKLLFITITEKRYEKLTKNAPTYPIRLITLASADNLTFNGLGG